MSRAHVDAVIVKLQEADILVGDGTPPSGRGWQGAPGQSEYVGYCIVWRLGSQEHRQTMMAGGYDDEARPLIFVRCFGGTAKQADELLDDVHGLLLDQTLAVTGQRMLRVWLDVTVTTSRNDSTETPGFEAGAYYRCWSVPA